MSDPLRPPGKTPRRAEPLQPDKAGGTETETAPEESHGDNRPADATTTRQAEQAKAAIDNVSKGYD